MDTEYKKQSGHFSDRWKIFASVKNKQDGSALRRALSPRIETIVGQFTDLNLKQRDDFYQALTIFAN